MFPEVFMTIARIQSGSGAVKKGKGAQNNFHHVQRKTTRSVAKMQWVKTVIKQYRL